MLENWIAVKDQIPPIDEMIMIACLEKYADKPHYHIFEGFYRDGSYRSKYHEHWLKKEYEEVTHWMPMPKPPLLEANEID